MCYHNSVMETLVVLVRHGESVGNLNKRFIGHTDVDLTPLGLKQADRTAEYLDKYKFDKIISSDLQRAYKTALATARRQGLEVEKDPAFREINAGEWEEVPFDRLSTLFPESHYVWENDMGNARLEGGESVKELFDRVSAAFDKVLQKYAGKKILIVCHATPIMMLECKVNGKDQDYCQQLENVPNASVTAVSVVDGKFTILERGTCDFMGELATSLPPRIHE